MIQRFELDLTTLINIITYLFFHCAAMDPKNQSQLGNSSQYNDKYGLRWQSTFLPELFLQGLDIDFITTLGTFKSTSSYSLLPWGSCELCHRNRNHNLQSVDKCSKVHNVICITRNFFSYFYGKVIFQLLSISLEKIMSYTEILAPEVELHS